jgi:hypothetical protein
MNSEPRSVIEYRLRHDRGGRLVGALYVRVIDDTLSVIAAGNGGH